MNDSPHPLRIRLAGCSARQAQRRLEEHIGHLSSWLKIRSTPAGCDIILPADEEAFDVRMSLLHASIPLFADEFYGYDDDRLEAVVGELLLHQQTTVSTAESCTGGLVAHLLTNLPGSSAYFIFGAVTYSNHAKQQILNLPAALLARHGAVSEPVAAAMAEGVRRVAGTRFGLSTTGIAGPSGGSREKPVGTVFVAVAGSESTVVKRYRFRARREGNKVRSACALLDLLRRILIASH